MATKTFAGRVEEGSLSFMNSLTRKQFGMSYGQYCSSVLIEAVKEGAELPSPASGSTDGRRRAAVLKMKSLSKQGRNKEVGMMSDAEIKDLIASRYED